MRRRVRGLSDASPSRSTAAPGSTRARCAASARCCAGATTARPFSADLSGRRTAAAAPPHAARARIPAPCKTACARRESRAPPARLLATCPPPSDTSARAICRPRAAVHRASRSRRRRAPRELPPDARNVIEFRNVCMHYPAGDIGLDGATFNVRRGEFVFIVGSTGSGKSTIMRLLIKEREPTVGHDPRRRPRPRRRWSATKVPYYRRNIGVVFQDFKLLPNRTVYDNVAYALSATGATAQGDPHEGARRPAPDGPVDEAAQLPRPALRRRAAARRRRARVRQPPAAAARRRADRQPRPAHVAGDHAAAVPHLPRRHDRARRDARLAHGRPHAPARHRAAAAGRSSATRPAACTPSASRRPTSSATCSTAPTASSAATAADDSAAAAT